MDSEQHSRTRIQPVRPDVHSNTMGATLSSAALPTATMRIQLGLAWTANAALLVAGHRAVARLILALVPFILAACTNGGSNGSGY